jgi:hypothetical protein
MVNRITAKVLITAFFLFGLMLLPASAQPDQVPKLEAKVKFYQAKIKKVENSIKSLNGKLKQVKKDKKRQAQISKMVKQEQKKLPPLKKTLYNWQNQLYKVRAEEAPPAPEIAPPKAEVLAPPKPTAPPLPRKFTLGAGLSGGAATLDLGYILQMNPNLELKADLGFGSGDKYTLLLFRALTNYFVMPETYVGASLDYGSYSTKVLGIVGLPAEIEKGGHVGLGAFIGLIMDKFETQLGYSTSLGIILTGSYRF